MSRRWGLLTMMTSVTIVIGALAACAAAPEPVPTEHAVPTPTTSAEAVPGGSLVMAAGLGSTCADGSVARAQVFGIPVTNRSSEPVQLTSATIEHVGGLDQLGIWVVGPEVPNDDAGASVSWADVYPPDAARQPGWADRTAVGETTISGGHTTWLAVAMELNAGSDVGNMANITLDYDDTAGSSSATAQATFGIGRRDGDEITCLP